MGGGDIVVVPGAGCDGCGVLSGVGRWLCCVEREAAERQGARQQGKHEQRAERFSSVVRFHGQSLPFWLNVL